ncbi:MAG: hypothetical protein QM778_39055 [Myxococcales bacterium]
MSRGFNVFCVLALLFVAACAGSSLTPLMGGAREPGAVFYVAWHEKDSRNLHQVVAGAIAARGLTVRAGPPAQRPSSVRFVVTYEDRWEWDIRMYLKKIVIRVHDVQTGALLGESEMHQGSLSAMGETYEDIIRRATQALFVERSTS